MFGHLLPTKTASSYSWPISLTPSTPQRPPPPPRATTLGLGPPGIPGATGVRFGNVQNLEDLMEEAHTVLGTPRSDEDGRARPDDRLLRRVQCFCDR